MKVKIICLIVMIGLFLSCSQKPLIIRIPVENPDSIPFKKFEKIFMGGFVMDSQVTDPDPRAELIDFFTGDFQQAIGRKVEYLSLEDKSTEPMTIMKEKLRNTPDSLLITGKLSIDIKSRSIIQNTKNEKGKKQKKFVKIELWEMKLKVIFIETDTFNILKENTYDEKLKDADPEKKKFNFKSLFDVITERLIQDSTRQVRMQERFLLKK